MLHGLLVGNLATWYFTVAPRLARRHQVLLYDLRGHGRSQRPSSGYGVDSMAGDLEALLDRFSAATPGPVTLIGHSYGGLIALRFALEHPERVARLAMVETPLPPSQPDDLGILASRTPEELVSALPAALQRIVGKSSARNRRGRRLLESLRALTMHTSLMDDIGAEPDISDDELAQLECPLLSVYGEASSCRPTGERLARLLPKGVHCTLPGGHYLPVEAPGPLSECLERFIDG